MLESSGSPGTLTPPAVSVAKGVLAWQEAPGALWYRIYRGRTPDFPVGPESYLTFAAKGTTAFQDLEEDFDGRERRGIYYYRLTTMDAHGFESPASPAVAVMATVFLGPEDAVLSGGVKTTRCPTAFSGQVAGWFANPGDQILFKAVPASDSFRIRYSNGDTAAKRCGLYVEGKRVATLNFPVTHSQSDERYVNGERVADATAQVRAGDWNIFSVQVVNVPVRGDVALCIDTEDAMANGSACCNIDRLEIEPLTFDPEDCRAK